jgi:hypothetical protein
MEAKTDNRTEIRKDGFFNRHYGTILAWLIGIAVFLLLCIFLMAYFTHERIVAETMGTLDKSETTGIVAVHEEAEDQATLEAKDTAEDYLAEQEAKKRRALKKWLAAQEKRVAKAKAKRAKEEAWERRTQEAWANTRRTWNGSGWDGLPLTRGRGAITGPSGKETYYNLNMAICVRIMRGMGFSEEEFPYEVREDGVKTLGGFVMVAANLSIRPKGSYIMTSCGPGIVVDTGGFASRNPTQLDLAVEW